MVCELSTHLAGTCGHEPVECPNAAAGCQESVMRKDAARHASEACAYRLSPCTHCRALFMARDLAEHEGICPEAQVECPNAGCGVTVARGGMAEHRGGCGREIVACPCPGCEERMVQAKVEEHVEASGAVHVRRAWRWAAEMEGTAVGLEQKVAEQGDVIVEQKAEIAMLQAKSALQSARIAKQATEIAEQDALTFGLQKRADALTRVFTWSTDSSFVVKQSASYTFTDGVRGDCFNVTVGNEAGVAFVLREGPACTMHYKCSILDKNDKVLRVVSRPESCDFRLPPVETACGIGGVEGAWFDLTEEDKAGAVREDGSIKLRMVVHLYLPE
ncbi:hypothetical protein T484DRAFT_1957511 [Baffinella frigidus]|nr:hypothetical protein T484DRAFT_1957511 [Cryptophyta sp. CCMP2293]